MIDVRAARHDPERFRRALARKGAADAFDEWLDADARWRELETQVTEMRAKTKLKGRPTPEQQEELRTLKLELKHLEDEHTQVANRRSELLGRVPNPPADDVPEGDT